jgi:hypothetical protein
LAENSSLKVTLTLTLKKRSARREPPAREDLSPEAEEEPLLEAVTGQLLVKILRAEEDLA